MDSNPKGDVQFDKLKKLLDDAGWKQYPTRVSTGDYLWCRIAPGTPVCAHNEDHAGVQLCIEVWDWKNIRGKEDSRFHHRMNIRATAANCRDYDLRASMDDIEKWEDYQEDLLRMWELVN